MRTHLLVTLIALMLLAGCGTFEVSVQQTEPAGPASPATLAPTAAPLTPLPAGRPILVAYVQDGNIHLYDEAAKATRTVFASGDVVRVTMSTDGQVIAFLRRTPFDQPELWEKISLWVVNRDGSNPRQLVDADELRQRLGTVEKDSAGIDQLEWIPGTHRLVYTANSYYLPGQGAIFSGDVYAVDTDTGADGVLAPDVTAEGYESLLLIPSPDGQQLALVTNTALSFINTDGSNWRPAALTYSEFARGDSQDVMLTGVWTQDSRAFLIPGPTSLDPYNDISFTIWRVPADGSASDSLASVDASHPGSVTFSPDGSHFAYVQYATDGTLEPLGWFISPLPAGVGPLAIPFFIDLSSYANLHWSPAGQTFTNTLLQLCPDAAGDKDICESPLSSFGGAIESIRWLDGSRLLYLGRDAPVLYLASLDGRASPIVTWSRPDISHSYSAAFAPGP